MDVQVMQQKMNQLGFVFLFLFIMLAPITTAGSNIAIYTLLLCYLLCGDWKKKVELCKNPVVIFAFLLLGWVMIGQLYSIAPWHADKLADPKVPLAYQTPMAYVRVIIAICSVLYLLHNKPKRQKMALIAILIGLFANLIAIYVNYFILSPSHQINFTNAGYPAAQTHFLTAMLFLFTCFGAFATLKHVANKKLKITIIVVGVVALIAEVFLNSARTGYVIELCMVFIYALYRFGLKGLLVGVLASTLLFGTAFMVSPIFHQRTVGAIQGVSTFLEGKSNHTSGGVRLFFYNTVSKIFYHNPERLLFGYGTNSIHYEFINYYKAHPLPKNFKLIATTNPHNQYLFFLLENGIIGLVLFLGLLYSILATIPTIKKPYDTYMFVLLLCFMLGSLLNSWLSDIGTSMTFCAYIATFMVVGKKEAMVSLWQEPSLLLRILLQKEGALQ